MHPQAVYRCRACKRTFDTADVPLDDGRTLQCPFCICGHAVKLEKLDPGITWDTASDCPKCGIRRYIPIMGSSPCCPHCDDGWPFVVLQRCGVLQRKQQPCQGEPA